MVDVTISMDVNPTQTPVVLRMWLSAHAHAVATTANSNPPKNRLPRCSCSKYAAVCSPGRTDGSRAPILVMYSLTSFGVF
jgi:hypothetical protein